MGRTKLEKDVDAVIQSVKMGLTNVRHIIMSVSGDDRPIQKAIEQGILVEDGENLRLVGIVPPPPAPKIAVKIEIKTPNQHPLMIPGLKCRNGDQAYPPYRVFTGDEAEVKAVVDDMQKCGINAHCRECGKNGKPRWILIVPTYVRGEYILGQEMTWKD